MGGMGPALSFGCVWGVGYPHDIEGTLASAQLSIYNWRYLFKKSLCENSHKTVLYTFFLFCGQILTRGPSWHLGVIQRDFM